MQTPTASSATIPLTPRLGNNVLFGYVLKGSKNYLSFTTYDKVMNIFTNAYLSDNENNGSGYIAMGFGIAGGIVLLLIFGCLLYKYLFGERRCKFIQFLLFSLLQILSSPTTSPSLNNLFSK